MPRTPRSEIEHRFEVFPRENASGRFQALGLNLPRRQEKKSLMMRAYLDG
jgi:hypothetical protein